MNLLFKMGKLILKVNQPLNRQFNNRHIYFLLLVRDQKDNTTENTEMKKALEQFCLWYLKKYWNSKGYKAKQPDLNTPTYLRQGMTLNDRKN